MRKLTPLVAALLFAIIPSTADARHEQNARTDAKQIIHLRHVVTEARARTWHYQDARHVARTPTVHLERNLHAPGKLWRLHQWWYHRSVTERKAWRRYEAAQRQRVAVSRPSGICWSCWARVASCESGGNPGTNTGNGFYGMYQFDYGSWLANGGGRYASRADLASASEQTYVAETYRQSSGLGPWPICGARY